MPRAVAAVLMSAAPSEIRIYELLCAATRGNLF